VSAVRMHCGLQQDRRELRGNLLAVPSSIPTIPKSDRLLRDSLEMGVCQYQFVRRYLERTPQLSLRQVDPLIRELVHYRDLINPKTQEPTS